MATVKPMLYLPLPIVAVLECGDRYLVVSSSADKSSYGASYYDAKAISKNFRTLIEAVCIRQTQHNIIVLDYGSKYPVTWMPRERWEEIVFQVKLIELGAA